MQIGERGEISSGYPWRVRKSAMTRPDKRDRSGEQLTLRGTPLPGGPFTPLEMVLWPVRALLAYVVAVCVMYLTLCMLGYALPAPAGELTILSPPSDLVLANVGAMLDELRKLFGQLVLLDGAPQPLAAALQGGLAFGAGRTLRTISGRSARRLASRDSMLDSSDQDSRHLSDDTAAGHESAAAAECAANTSSEDHQRQNRDQRIAGVQAAVTQLDSEWLSYTQDLTAYYLTKPILRDPAVAQTAAYQAALFELREHADELNAQSTDEQIRTAEDAAETALTAWSNANDHAIAVGVSDRSPTERAALRRLHALVGQLTDPGTPRPMWKNLREKISREMSKLETVPATWDHLAKLPALEGRHLTAIRPAEPVVTEDPPRQQHVHHGGTE